MSLDVLSTADDVDTDAADLSVAAVTGICVIGILAVFVFPGTVYGIVFAGAYVPYPGVLLAYAFSGSLLALLQLLVTFHIGVSNLRIWGPMCALFPLPILSYAVFNSTPLQIVWGMVASLAIYNLYMIWQTIRFVMGRERPKGNPAA